MPKRYDRDYFDRWYRKGGIGGTRRLARKVALLLAHFLVAGRWLKGVDAGRPLPSAKALRLFNELPVLLLVGIVYLVLAKPF